MNIKKMKVLFITCFFLSACQNINTPIIENVKSDDFQKSKILVSLDDILKQKSKILFNPNDILKITKASLESMENFSYNEIYDIQDNKDFSVIVIGNPIYLPQRLVFIKKNDIEYHIRYSQEYNIPGSNYCEPCSEVVAKFSKISLQALKDKLKVSPNSNPKWSKKLNEIYQKYS